MATIIILGVDLVYKIRGYFADAIPLVLCGMMGSWLCEDALIDQKSRPILDFVSMIIIGLIYSGIHCIPGLFLKKSNINLMVMYFPTNFGQYLIILAIGIWIGLMFLLIKPSLTFRSQFKNNVIFSIGVFGSIWLIFNCFYNKFFDGILLATLTIGILDICSTILGIYVVDKIQHWKKSE